MGKQQQKKKQQEEEEAGPQPRRGLHGAAAVGVEQYRAHQRGAPAALARGVQQHARATSSARRTNKRPHQGLE